MNKPGIYRCLVSSGLVIKQQYRKISETFLLNEADLAEEAIKQKIAVGQIQFAADFAAGHEFTEKLTTEFMDSEPLEIIEDNAQETAEEPKVLYKKKKNDKKLDPEYQDESEVSD